jgi:hypothetical protein
LALPLAADMAFWTEGKTRLTRSCPPHYNPFVRAFTVVDLTPQCQIRQTTQYGYEVLERLEGAAELIGLCSGRLWASPDEFELALPQTEGRLNLRWRSSADSAGIATLRDADRTLSLSLLAGGQNPDADAITLQAFQQHAVHEFHGTAIEPSFDLIHVRERPLLATVGLFAPADVKDRLLFGLIDRCFAAAYFRKLGLA